jgi:hypothetical protein
MVTLPYFPCVPGSQVFHHRRSLLVAYSYPHLRREWMQPALHNLTMNPFAQSAKPLLNNAPSILNAPRTSSMSRGISKSCKPWFIHLRVRPGVLICHRHKLPKMRSSSNESVVSAVEITQAALSSLLRPSRAPAIAPPLGRGAERFRLRQPR